MSDTKMVLETLLNSAGLTSETRLYRATLTEFLDAQGMLSANANPSEAVTDIYEAGHTTQAEYCGPGLAFVESAAEDWQDDDRVIVEIRLGDVFEQGGLLYPVVSVVTEPAWYCTLPAGRIATRTVK